MYIYTHTYYIYIHIVHHSTEYIPIFRCYPENLGTWDVSRPAPPRASKATARSLRSYCDRERSRQTASCGLCLVTIEIHEINGNEIT